MPKHNLVNRAIKELIERSRVTKVSDFEAGSWTHSGGAYQLVFDFEHHIKDKPPVIAVDELVKIILRSYEPGLTLPSVRVSGRMRRTLGSYTPAKKLISISSRLLALGDEGDIREVVLHEVAHAIVHWRRGERPAAHGKEFRSVCLQIGAKPHRYVDVRTDDWDSRIRHLSKCEYCHVWIVRKRRMKSVRCVCGIKLYPQSWCTVAPEQEGVAGDWVRL